MKILTLGTAHYLRGRGAGRNVGYAIFTWTNWGGGRGDVVLFYLIGGLCKNENVDVSSERSKCLTMFFLNNFV